MIRKLPIFPLGGAVLFPGLQLPLHIFEPRYRALIGHALATDRMIGMVQPRARKDGVDDRNPALFDVGCMGKITEVEALDDGRYNILLGGEARFRVARELDGKSDYRRIEADVEDAPGDGDTLAAIERAALEREAKRFAQRLGYAVDWAAVGDLDDRTLVNGIAQVAPFDGAAKQALLEADTLGARSELAIQLMQFFGRHDGDETIVTLQ